MRRLLAVEPRTLTSENVPAPAQVASWPELLESLATHPGCAQVRDWILGVEPVRQAALDGAAHVFELRGNRATCEHDGDLEKLASAFTQKYGLDYSWSASRLESYRICPFFFFVGHVLHLEPREKPSEGLDVRQLGNIYHHILEVLYQAVDDPTDLQQLLQALPRVAGQTLDRAPHREGFRKTAWWAQTRAEIVENVQRSVKAMAELAGDFVPYWCEAPFGLKDQATLVVHDGDDSFRLRGYIDRVDRSPGGHVRVIDYKTSGPSGFTKRAAIEGKKIQVSLYALAARDALKLGEPVEGFYWHVQHAEPSRFTMSGFDGGAEGAIASAVEHAWEAIRSARGGYFVPHPPTTGCPAYCPAASFCWHYRPGFGG